MLGWELSVVADASRGYAEFVGAVDSGAYDGDSVAAVAADVGLPVYAVVD